jgi:hypothetical protein
MTTMMRPSLPVVPFAQSPLVVSRLVMSPLVVSLLVASLLVTWISDARAVTVSSGQAEAKEAARSGNCTPSKVEVLRYGNGRESETVFKVSCNEDKNAFVLVQCRGRSCALLR